MARIVMRLRPRALQAAVRACSQKANFAIKLFYFRALLATAPDSRIPSATLIESFRRHAEVRDARGQPRVDPF